MEWQEISQQVMNIKVSLTSPWLWAIAYLGFVSTIGYQRTIKWTKAFAESHNSANDVGDAIAALVALISSPIWVALSVPTKLVNKALCWPNEQRK